MKFGNQADNQQFVIVGVAKELQLNPRQVGGGFLYTYKLVDLIYVQWFKQQVISCNILQFIILSRVGGSA